MTRGVFVTGTDTGIGKTVVAAALARRWGAEYWKPVQTGVATEASDAETVASLAPGTRIHPSRHVFQAPLSPEEAGEAEGVVPALDEFTLPTSPRLIVEGAGGALVPLGGGALLIDLMARLGLPAIVVARTTLGTINHTLLTLHALRARRIAVGGVVMVGHPNAGNRAAIERHGKVAVLATVPPLHPLDAETLGRVLPLLPAQPP